MSWIFKSKVQSQSGKLVIWRKGERKKHEFQPCTDLVVASLVIIVHYIIQPSCFHSPYNGTTSKNPWGLENKVRMFCSWLSFPKPLFLCRQCYKKKKKKNMLYWQKTKHILNFDSSLLGRSKAPRSFCPWIKQLQPEENPSYFSAISLSCWPDLNQSRSQAYGRSLYYLITIFKHFFSHCSHNQQVKAENQESYPPKHNDLLYELFKSFLGRYLF